MQTDFKLTREWGLRLKRWTSSAEGNTALDLGRMQGFAAGFFFCLLIVTLFLLKSPDARKAHSRRISANDFPLSCALIQK